MRLTFLMIAAVICFSCNESKEQSAETETQASVDSKDVVAEGEDFQLEVFDFEGLEPKLNTATDSTYIVNFWTTWCKPCIKELPHFEKIGEDYKDKKVKVMLVSLDFPTKYESLLKPYVLEHNLQSEVVALNDPDANAWINKVSETWSGAIPATLIFNKNNREFYEQSFDYNELESELKQFLN